MKAKFGAMMVDGSGKLGGHVWAKNRGGNYVRTKTTPLNPQTTSQTTVRNTFTGNSQAWRGLTDAERAAWTSATANFKGTDQFGDVRSLSGSQLYMRINNNLVNVGAAVLSVPPVPTAVTPLSSIALAFSSTASTSTITFAPTPIPTGYKLILEGTAPTSAGVSFVKNKFRKIIVVAAAGASPENWYAAYVAKFGTAAIGQRITVRGKYIDTTTGLTSQWLEATTITV